MGIGNVILSGVKQTFKIAIGVALTVAVFFGVGWLTDRNASQNTRLPEDPKFRPYTVAPNRPAPEQAASQQQDEQPSFLETLKEKPASKQQPLSQPPAPPAQKTAPALPAGAAKNEVADVQQTPPPDAKNGRARQEPSAVSSVTYTIQLGSFQNAEVAQAFGDSLSAKGYPVHVLKTDVPDKGTVYRVRVGKFTTMEDAQAMAVELEKKENVSAFITSR